MYTIEELNVQLLSELQEVAHQLGIKKYQSLSKEELIYKILDEQALAPKDKLKSLQDRKVASAVAPTKSNDRAQGGAVEDKPQRAAVESRPLRAAIEGKPRGAAIEGKPRGAAIEGKPQRTAVEGKPSEDCCRG